MSYSPLTRNGHVEDRIRRIRFPRDKKWVEIRVASGIDPEHRLWEQPAETVATWYRIGRGPWHFALWGCQETVVRDAAKSSLDTDDFDMMVNRLRAFGSADAKRGW